MLLLEMEQAYYEGTSSYIPVKNSERVTRVIFLNSFQLLLLKISQNTKTSPKSTMKECCRNATWVSL